MTSRLIAALAYTGAAFLFGVALGERGELGFVQTIFTIVIPIATIVLTVFAKRNKALTLFTGIVMLAGLLLGQWHFARAWDECLYAGVRTRAALESYREQNEFYPARLEDLEGDTPCACGFRETILHYLANDRGFRLWMTNDRETIVFTASGRSSNRRSN